MKTRLRGMHVTGNQWSGRVTGTLQRLAMHRRWPMRVCITKSSIKVFDPGISVTPLMGNLECMVGRWSVPVGRLHVLAYVRLTLAINRIE